MHLTTLISPKIRFMQNINTEKHWPRELKLNLAIWQIHPPLQMSAGLIYIFDM